MSNLAVPSSMFKYIQETPSRQNLCNQYNNRLSVNTYNDPIKTRETCFSDSIDSCRKSFSHTAVSSCQNGVRAILDASKNNDTNFQLSYPFLQGLYLGYACLRKYSQ